MQVTHYNVQCNAELREMADQWGSLNQNLSKHNKYSLSMRLTTTRKQMAEVLVGQKFLVNRQEMVNAILKIKKKFSDMHILICNNDEYAFSQTFLVLKHEDGGEEEDEEDEQLNQENVEEEDEEAQQLRHKNEVEEVEEAQQLRQKNEEEEAGRKEGEKDESIEDQTGGGGGGGFADSKDLFDTDDEEMSKRAVNCTCNEFLCECVEKEEESQSLLNDI